MYKNFGCDGSCENEISVTFYVFTQTIKNEVFS